MHFSASAGSACPGSPGCCARAGSRSPGTDVGRLARRWSALRELGIRDLRRARRRRTSRPRRADTSGLAPRSAATNPELVAARGRGLRVLHRSAGAGGADGRSGAGSRSPAPTARRRPPRCSRVALTAAGLDPSYAIGGELTGGATAAPATAPATLRGRGRRVRRVVPRLRPGRRRRDERRTRPPGPLRHRRRPSPRPSRSSSTGCSPAGSLVACADDPGSAALAAHARARRRPGPDLRRPPAGADVRLERRRGRARRPSAVLLERGRRSARAAARGARASTTCSTRRRPTAPPWSSARTPDAVLDGLAGFGGARRRFELKGEAAGVRVVDDYAHHPTEVEALLRAARAGGRRRPGRRGASSRTW